MSLDPSSHIIAKITDYGISVHASPAGTPGTLGSPGYSAPEVVSLRVQGKQMASYCLNNNNSKI